MRLSEAIRLGATMSEQGFGTFISDDGSACALGAAAVAIGRGDNDTRAAGAVEVWEELLHDSKHWCPVDCEAYYTGDLFDSIAHLNDDHRWTREAIADWVELQEGPPAEECVDWREHADVIR